MAPTSSSKARLLHETLRRYLKMDASENIDKVIAKTRDEDLALVLSSMLPKFQHRLFERLPTTERKAGVIVEMAPPFGKDMLEPMEPEVAAAILREMASDDAADIIADLSEEHAQRVLHVLDHSDEVEELMSYDEDTAGGIMLPDFVALVANNTAEEAVRALRQAGDVEMIYYIYVVDDADHLVGVLSLRKLVAAPPETLVKDLMDSDVISVRTDADQEDVARMVARYGFVAVPVVDDTNKLLGIVTVDDVIDVIQDEATEDILKMAGAGTGLPETAGVWPNLRVRVPWLLASSVGGLIAAGVMGSFEETLKTHHYLALFVPIILGLSGNVGTQSATVTVRALAVGQLGHSDKSWRVVRRELLIGIVLGLFFGVAIGGIGWAFAQSFFYGTTIGLSLAAGMIVSNVVGTAIPLMLARLNIDPAVATGPLVTTSVDILGILTYFSIATLLGAFLPATGAM